jgi:7,8-dihydroneopterin aldolase/epimerase/oxygenase
MSTFTIQLRDLRFFANHGLHEEERLAGTTFLVDVDVTAAARKEMVTKIDDTMDYVKVYAIVKKFMQQPTPLLETLCMLIADDIHQEFPSAERVSITITKLSPPITNFSGSVAVSYTKAFV